eukprot:NODE_12134_length_266_cov_140.113744.p3 GENE.NODE_12134_length_266_cov_140.113744~~NODE_12134_length_266_cov_140.113744.p3  ORF type:complete len:55 (+),score=9.19 NODE_12134_length_266_cov_140.113744:3-167(+)
MGDQALLSTCLKNGGDPMFLSGPRARFDVVQSIVPERSEDWMPGEATEDKDEFV